MKNLKTLIILVALAAAFASCSKKGNDPTPKTPTDFTAYYFAAKILINTANGPVNVPMAIIMKPNNSAFIIVADNETADGSYKYENGHLKYQFDGNVNFDITLNGDK